MDALHNHIRPGMPKKYSLRSAKRPFVETILSCANLCAAMLPFVDRRTTNDAIQGWQLLHHAQARRVVALSFMNIVSAWEEFVQSCFIRYMAGASSENCPRLRMGPCQSLKHAGQVLMRRSNFDFESDYISWTPWNQVVDRAKIFFEGGLPFAAVNASTQKHVDDAFKLRNRVAHSSEKCRTDFVEVAKRHLGIPVGGNLTRGYDAGSLLLAQPKLFGATCGQDTYFMAYVDLFMELADLIVPAKSGS